MHRAVWEKEITGGRGDMFWTDGSGGAMLLIVYGQVIPIMTAITFKSTVMVTYPVPLC